MAIELEEDRVLSEIADVRSEEINSGKEKLYSHEAFWKLALQD